MSSATTTSPARLALVLGLLSAIGPFAVDMYLPALPTIAADLNVSTASAQMTLTAFFATFGVLQIVYGPVADMIGRKRPLYVGVGLFFVGSVGAVFAGSMDALLVCRFVQGIGAASVMVIPRAIIRDLYTGIAATRLMSLIMLVISVSPLLAPLAGSALIAPFGWRAVFAALAVSALLSLALIALMLPETLREEERVPLRVSSLVNGFATLLVHRRFLALTFIAGLALAGFFVYIAGSSFIFIDRFGLTPTQYSGVFAVNAVGFLGMAQLTAPLGERFGMMRVVLFAMAIHTLCALVLLATTLVGLASLPVLVGLLFLCFACHGLVVPSTSVLALEEHGPIAGMASALGGTLQMLIGGAAIVAFSVVSDGSPTALAATLVVCGFAGLAITVASRRAGDA